MSSGEESNEHSYESKERGEDSKERNVIIKTYTTHGVDTTCCGNESSFNVVSTQANRQTADIVLDIILFGGLIQSA